MSNKTNTNHIAKKLGITKNDFKQFCLAVQELVSNPNLAHALVEKAIDQLREQGLEQPTVDDVADVIVPERKAERAARQAQFDAQQAQAEEKKCRKECITLIVMCIGKEIERRQGISRRRQDIARQHQDKLRTCRKKSARAVEVGRATKELRASFAADLKRQIEETQKIAAQKITAVEKALDGLKKRVIQLEKVKTSMASETIPFPAPSQVRRQSLNDAILRDPFAEDAEDSPAVSLVKTAESIHLVSQNSFLSLRDVNSSKRLNFWNDIYKHCVQLTANDTEFKFWDFREKVQNGTSPLTQKDLIPYMAAYSGHHYHKLRAAFVRTQFADLQGKKVEIVDWGCGQAVATCVLLDWLLENNILINISRITLIEPSSDSLKAGTQYVQRTLSGTQNVMKFIRTVNACLDNLTDKQIETDTSDIKIHLFSNILDVDGINLADLSARIMRCSRGQNRFICSSPRYGNCGTRLDQFKAFFAAKCSLTNLRSVDDNLFGEIFLFVNRQYGQDRVTRCERQFTATF